jgi:hypothetical protein
LTGGIDVLKWVPLKTQMERKMKDITMCRLGAWFGVGLVTMSCTQILMGNAQFVSYLNVFIGAACAGMNFSAIKMLKD